MQEWVHQISLQYGNTAQGRADSTQAVIYCPNHGDPAGIVPLFFCCWPAECTLLAATQVHCRAVTRATFPYLTVSSSVMSRDKHLLFGFGLVELLLL